MTLKQRPGREPVFCGLVIDDFIILERYRGEAAPALREEETEGRKRMVEVRKSYEAAGLPRHEGKAVEQAEKVT